MVVIGRGGGHIAHGIGGVIEGGQRRIKRVFPEVRPLLARRGGQRLCRAQPTVVAGIEARAIAAVEAIAAAARMRVPLGHVRRQLLGVERRRAGDHVLQAALRAHA